MLVGAAFHAETGNKKGPPQEEPLRQSSHCARRHRELATSGYRANQALILSVKCGQTCLDISSMCLIIGFWGSNSL